MVLAENDRNGAGGKGWARELRELGFNLSYVVCRDKKYLFQKNECSEQIENRGELTRGKSQKEVVGPSHAWVSG